MCHYWWCFCSRISDLNSRSECSRITSMQLYINLWANPSNLSMIMRGTLICFGSMLRAGDIPGDVLFLRCSRFSPFWFRSCERVLYRVDLEWMCKFRSTAVSFSIVAFLSSPMLSLTSPTVLILLVSALVIYVVRLLVDFISSIQKIKYVFSSSIVFEFTELRLQRNYPGPKNLLCPTSIYAVVFPSHVPYIATGSKYPWIVKHDGENDHWWRVNLNLTMIFLHVNPCVRFQAVQNGHNLYSKSYTFQFGSIFDAYTQVSAWPRAQISFDIADAAAAKVRSLLFNGCSEYHWYITMQEVATKRTVFPKPLELYQLPEVFGSNIVGTEGYEWKRHRNIAYPAFSEVRSSQQHHQNSSITRMLHSRTTSSSGMKLWESRWKWWIQYGGMRTKWILNTQQKWLWVWVRVAWASVRIRMNTWRDIPACSPSYRFCRQVFKFVIRIC